jgi:cytochrome c553
VTGAKNMSLRLLPAALAFVAFAFAGTAAAAKAGNAAAGKQKAAVCAACHGDGNKTLDNSYPRLAGQYPDYLEKALKEYRSGKRTNLVMKGQAASLKDEDIADLAAYFGSLDGEIHDLSKHGH